MLRLPLQCCSHGPGLEPFVATSLVQLLSRMTKLCWYDDDEYRKIVDNASRLLEKGSAGQPGLYLMGLKLLSMLVTEMNQPTSGRTLTQHRKIAVAFRDQALLKTFQLAQTAMKQLHRSNAADNKLKEQVELDLDCSIVQSQAWHTLNMLQLAGSGVGLSMLIV